MRTGKRDCTAEGECAQVGDAKAGSRAARPGTGYRRRAVGTRDKVISHLAQVEDITDGAGMASTRLAEAVAYPGSSVAFAQLLSGMERDGLIAREVRGKRTYRISLTERGEQRRQVNAPKGGTGRARAASGAGGSDGGVGGGGVGGGARSAGTARSRRSGGMPFGALADSAASTSSSASSGGGDAPPVGDFDYDELARRLLVQVVRRLAARPDDLGPTADAFSLEETVAGLERELATAWTRHGTLTAENVKLRQQLREAQRDLEAERRARRSAARSSDLDHAEAVLLDRLLSPADEPGASAG
jgi:hypothetical protein